MKQILVKGENTGPLYNLMLNLITRKSPAEEAQSLSPTHKHLSRYSGTKHNKLFLMSEYMSVRAKQYNESTVRCFTCFWAAKITFMKFMYWREQSPAALITCPVQHRGYIQVKSK